MCTVNSITDHGLTFGVGTVVVVCKFSMTAVTLGSSLLILLLPEARKERRRKNFNFHISFSAQLPFSPLVFTFWHLLQASDKRLIFACSLFSLHPLIHFKIFDKIKVRKEERRKNFNFHISFSAQLPFSPLVFTFWHLLQASDKRLIFACSLFSLHPLIHFKISPKNRCWNYLWKLFIIRNQLI